MGKEVQGNSLVRAAKPNAQALNVVNFTSCDLSITAERAQREQADFQPSPPDRDLIKEIAMDIGKEVVAYIEVMYPQAIEATSSTFKLSVRNCIHNQIMAALEVTEEGAIRARLQDRKKFRREWLATYRKIRKQPPIEAD